MTILVADATGAQTTPILALLATKDHDIERHQDGLRAFEAARRGIYDLVVLEANLPVMDGAVVCRALREARVTTPILIVGQESSRDTLIAGLDAGADDYLASEEHPEVIRARVCALLRRAAATRAPLQVADLTLDMTTRRAQRAGKLIPLSSTEYTLLEFLMRQAGRVVSRPTIMAHVWPEENRESDNVLDVYISYLRNKIDRGHEPTLIHTIRSQGYVLGPRAL